MGAIGLTRVGAIALTRAGAIVLTRVGAFRGWQADASCGAACERARAARQTATGIAGDASQE